MNQELVNRFIELQDKANNEIDLQGETTDETYNELMLTSKMLEADDMDYLLAQMMDKLDSDNDDWEPYNG